MMPTFNLMRIFCMGCLLAPAISGCGPAPDLRDQRLAEFAERAVTEQTKQNERMTEVLKQDAESRQQLIAAQESMTSQLNQQQSAIDADRMRLEEERRSLAAQRNRDPIVAAAIQSMGIVAACVLPLVVAVFVIRQMQSQEPDHAAVAELLVMELTSERPRFFSAVGVPRLVSASRPFERQLLDDSADTSTEAPF